MWGIAPPFIYFFAFFLGAVFFVSFFGAAFVVAVFLTPQAINPPPLFI
jgi:hypothetical protein